MPAEGPQESGVCGGPGVSGACGLRAQPEMSRNVQKYSKDVYLRASEAAQCRVHSTVVLPLFTAPDRRRSLGVVEVVQTQQDMSFSEIVATLARSLEARARSGRPCMRLRLGKPALSTSACEHQAACLSP